MSSSVTQKVLIDLETSKATEEMKKLAKAGGNTADTIKALNARAKELETSLGQIKAAAPTSTFTAFKGALKSVGDAMQPFNQGLELGKKLLGLAEDGLAAYAKTSREAARDVRDLTNEFIYYKNQVLGKVGEITVELGKNAVNFDQAMEALRRGGEKGFGKAYGDITKQWNALNDTVFDSARAFSAFGDSLSSTFGTITNKVAKNATDAMEAAAAKARELAAEARALHEAFEEARAADAYQRRIAIRAEIDNRFAPGSGLQPIQSPEQIANDNARGADLLEQVSRNDRYAKSSRNRNETYLASVFGPIEDFSAYATAFGTLNTAVQSAMGAWINGSMSLGAAIKKGIGDALAGLASQMAVEALKHGAYALGSLAFGDVRGAAQHGQAAAAFAATSVAAAVAAKSMSSAAAAPQGAGASGGSGGGATWNGGSGGSGSGQGERVIVVIGDSFSQDSPRMRQLSAERAVNLAYGGDGVNHN